MSKLADVYGIQSVRVSTSQALENALDAAFKLKQPAFVDGIVGSIADRAPPVHSWLKRKGVDPEHIGQTLEYKHFETASVPAITRSAQ
jgi:acetolactate synthase-1/2/3 large subunit